MTKSTERAIRLHKNEAKNYRAKARRARRKGDVALSELCYMRAHWHNAQMAQLRGA